MRPLIRLLKTSPVFVPVLLLANVLLRLTDLLAVWTAPKPAEAGPSLLLIKLDLLGDYVLFRAWLRYLKQHPDYQHYRFTLVGNPAYRSLAETFDADLIDRFVWVDIYQLATRPRYRFGIVWQLRQRRYDVTLDPTYSRVLVLNDFLVAASGAPVRVGCVTDFTNAKRWEAAWGDRLFTKLLPMQPGIIFEAERYRQTFSALLKTELPLLRPVFDPAKLPALPMTLPRPYLLLAPGASEPKNRWPITHLAEIVQRVRTEFPAINLIVTGVAAEQPLVDELRAMLPDNILIVNTMGKLSIPGLVAAVAGAQAVLANDSGTAHIAAAVGVGCVVPSRGKSLVRWHPYPADLAPLSRTVYPPGLSPFSPVLIAKAADFQKDSPIPISRVGVDAVWAALRPLLGQDRAAPAVG
jgi:ADP-heptose:LPS heptosyltransferase